MSAALAIKRLLAEQNGGPGLTLDEMAQRTGFAKAHLRSTIQTLVFDQGVVTCRHDPATKDDRFMLGDPEPLLLGGLRPKTWPVAAS